MVNIKCIGNNMYCKQSETNRVIFFLVLKYCYFTINCMHFEGNNVQVRFSFFTVKELHCIFRKKLT